MRSAVQWVLLVVCGCYGSSNLSSQQIASTAPVVVAEADLVSRLQGKSLFLRGMWRGDKLSFDAQGQLRGKAEVQSFTVSSIQVDAVKVAGGKIEIDGHRYGLEFKDDVPVRVPLAASPGSKKVQTVALTIARPADGNYGPALAAIFADSLEQMTPLLPEAWQDAAARGFDFSKPSTSPELAGVYKLSKAMQPPRLVQHKDPEFSQAARAMRYTGACVVSIVIDAQGSVTHLRITRAAGLGMDENAVDVVSHYRFEPARLDGMPVAVSTDVAVDFRIF